MDEIQFDHRALEAAGEIAAHPERKALANLYSALSAVVGMVFIMLAMVTPAVVWWAYHAAVS